MPSAPDPTPSTAPDRGLVFDRALEGMLLRPALVLAALVCGLSAAASFRVPIRQVAPWVGALLLAWLFTLGWARTGVRVKRVGLLLALLAALSAWLALADFSGRPWPAPSQTVSAHGDAWSYNTLADYLQNHARGRDAGMSLVGQFGGHLGNTRFAAPTLLAFLEALPWPGDPVRVQWVFAVGCLLTHFCSMLYLGRALLGGWGWATLGAILATAGGWLSDVIYCGNYDNLVFVALTPALLGVLCRMSAAPANRSFTPMVGRAALLGAALLYCYPEGLILFGFLAFPLVVALGWSAWRSGETRRLQALGLSCAGALVLASPYLPTLVNFLRGQAAMGVQSGPRPGSGVMPGLLNERFLPSPFALGEEFNASYVLANNLLPLVLLALLGWGSRRIGKRFAWFPWVGLSLAVLLVWQNVLARYDYGTYKVILCATWWVYPTVVAGLAGMAERTGRFGLGTIPLGAALLLAVGYEKFEDRRARPAMPPVAMQPLRELPEIRFVTGDAPVLLALDDDFDTLWALFYLRGFPVNLAQPRSYLAMPHIAPWLARAAAPAVADCQYVLLSGPRPGAVWRNARFSLVRRANAALIGVDNPNGVEQVEGRRWVWLSTRPTTFRVLAPAAGDYELQAQRFVPGPSGPAAPERALEVTTEPEGERRTASVRADTRGLPLRLRAGMNTVRLRCLDAPNQTVQPNGDARELMLALHDYEVSPVVPPLNP